MARRRLLVSLTAAAVVASIAAAGSPGAAAKPKASPPDKVVIIVVDALSKEIVEKYDMKNVEKLMAQGVDTPNGYLGHTGSVTVATHNVLTTGMQPRNMGWTNEGYRDVRGLIGPAGGLYITSNFGAAEMAPLQRAAGAPHLSDYLDDTGKVFTVSPKGYAAYGLSGPGSANTSVITFASKTCPVPGSTTDATQRRRAPTGINVPAYISAECGSRYVVARDTIYDTGQLPASLYPATDDRYVVGNDPAHQGGDVWATDAVVDIMGNEKDAWSGIFVSLPGVDKAAHMWGGVNDPEQATPGYDAMTHMEYATATADAQVGRIMRALKDSGELDSTLVVLTADHGSVAAAGGRFNGTLGAGNDYGYYNWYYGDPLNDVFYDKPQPALQPLVATGNLGLSYSDSSLNVWLTDQSPAKIAEAAAIMEDMPDVTAVWRRDGDHFTRVTPVRYDRMGAAEKAWFDTKAQELVDTQAADHGPDLIATLPDDTTYSVLGDHGGIQRSTQQIPIVFAGSYLSHRDLDAEVTSIDVMPTILAAMGIKPTYSMDGTAHPLPYKNK